MLHFIRIHDILLLVASYLNCNWINTITQAKQRECTVIIHIIEKFLKKVLQMIQHCDILLLVASEKKIAVICADIAQW